MMFSFDRLIVSSLAIAVLCTPGNVLASTLRATTVATTAEENASTSTVRTRRIFVSPSEDNRDGTLEEFTKAYTINVVADEASSTTGGEDPFEVVPLDYFDELDGTDEHGARRDLQSSYCQGLVPGYIISFPQGNCYAFGGRFYEPIQDWRRHDNLMYSIKSAYKIRFFVYLGYEYKGKGWYWDSSTSWASVPSGISSVCCRTRI